MFSFLCCSTREDGYSEEQEAAAVKIQALQRGKQGRRDFNAYKAAAATSTEVEELGGAEAGAADAPPPPARLLQVEIVGAKGLKDVVGARLRGKKSDPFCYCEVGDIKFQTAIQKNKLAPVWNESFEVVDCPSDAEVKFMIAHPAVKKNPEICLGKATVQADLYQENGWEGTLTLSETGLKKGDAFLTVKLSWMQRAAAAKRISAFKEVPVEMWIVRFRSVGLRSGPGVSEGRIGVDLTPGEEFGVIEVVEGQGGQQYLRLADGRGWAFTKSLKDGEVLCEPMVEKEVVEADEGVDDPTQETAEAPEAIAEPEAEQ
eukprot:TRINITY_DN20688_c0_g1_i1.p1 TRINITY_DN20688_c0_g1~~TRINITY_DN20688_c0_g1_i1.p1  ORF type:complete len:316 (-),score=103.03 TRINITY_DN20688_c0_g1_i1:316-1263(-)